ncbi:TPA: hypothetical protein ACHYZI_005350 [Escherichia coli]
MAKKDGQVLNVIHTK